MESAVFIPSNKQEFEVSELTLIHVTGPDAKSFLQGQLTCDVKSVENLTWVAGGYCNAQGKLISAFRLAEVDNTYHIMLPKTLAPQVIESLKKYAVFSNVEIQEKLDLHFIANWGQDVSAPAPGTIEQQQNSHIWNLGNNLQLTIEDQPSQRSSDSEYNWQHAMFALGWVDVPENMAGTQLPQAFNLDINEGINFKKGCYIGQEAIARMHYRGKTKKRAVRFLGSCRTQPTSEVTLQVKVGENWRRAGAILSSVRYHDGVVALIALVSADLDETAQCRVEGQDDSQFTRCPD